MYKINGYCFTAFIVTGSNPHRGGSTNTVPNWKLLVCSFSCSLEPSCGLGRRLPLLAFLFGLYTKLI